MIKVGWIDFLFPAQCMLCSCTLGANTGLCAACWKKIKWIGSECCSKCGYPLEIGGNLMCGACHQNPPNYMQARSLFGYDENSRNLILRYKHGDQTHYAPIFAQWLQLHAHSLCEKDTWVVAVPLHWTRLLKRKFNQAALLGLYISKLIGHPFQPALARIRLTRSQGGLSRTGRRENIRKAFMVKKRFQADIQGRSFLLIDDVYTTGATVEACTQALLQSGARSVKILTLGRVIK